MKKRTRIIAFLLIITTLIANIPVSALAADDIVGDVKATSEAATVNDSRFGEAETESAPTEGKEDKADIVAEQTDNREECKKEYMLSDGQTLLMLFPEPVHYYVNDKWENIDNTLVAKEIDGNSILTNKAGAWNVTLPSQISTDSPISLESGKYKLSFSFLGQLKGTGETGAENAVKVDGASYQSESIQTSKGII